MRTLSGIKRFTGLLKEDFKSKLWMVLAVWYVFGMFCLLLSVKRTIPQGEARSLYVGAGNTSFFAGMMLFGILAGAGTFHYLYSGQKADLYFSLPFSGKQLFAAGCLNSLLIFSSSAIICKLLFFRISLSMGYSRYEDSVCSVWMGCLILVLGYLFVMNLTMLAFLLAQNMLYRCGLLVLFFLGPGALPDLAEKMFRIFSPSFYRSEMLETWKGYLSPLSLLKNAAGIEEYVDGSLWITGDHLPYILYLLVLTAVLFCINLFYFQIRPVERRKGAFTFKHVEWFVRYSCMILAVLWIVNAFQIFSFGIFQTVCAVLGILLGVPLMHGLLNVIITCDARRFVSAKYHFLLEMSVMILLTVIFSLGGKRAGEVPSKESICSMAVVLTALDSGDEDSRVLQNMKLVDKEIETAYDWVNAGCREEAGDYELIVKYELQNGKIKYYRYQIPWPALYDFDAVFAGTEYKKGVYEALQLDDMKYYEIQWTNGMESYTLDLNEQERRELLEAYREDFAGLTFQDIRMQTPVGKFNFSSMKNQGDVTGYIYPGFERVLELLNRYGIDGAKGISDYEITKIIVDKYVLTEGLLYHWNSLEWEKTFTDKAYVKELAGSLCWEELCKDYQLNEKNPDMEFTVYYRDSEGKTAAHIKCRAQADPAGNEALKELLRL